jgi:hypothetical protein
MNPREMRLLIALGVILGVGGVGILVYQWFYKPLQDYNKAISRLIRDNEQKDDQLFATMEERKLLDRARVMSLSPKMEMAQSEYGSFLDRVIYHSGLEIDDFRPIIENAEAKAVSALQTVKPGHRTVTYQIRARGDLSQLVKALDAIQKTPLIHRIRSLDISRLDVSKNTTDRLLITMRIEAMIVGRAEEHADGPLAPEQRLIVMETLMALRHGPTGLGLLPWVIGPTGPVARQSLALESGYRQYGDIGRKNIFRGGDLPPKEDDENTEPVDPPPEFDVRDYVRLDTTDPDNKEAFLRNLVFKAQPIRLRSTSWSGFNTFRIHTGELKSHVLLTGKVLRIEQRDVYFQVRDDVYCIHLGQTLAEAMRRRIPDSELEAHHVTLDEAWAEAQNKEAQQTAAAPKKKGKGR